MKSHSVAVLLLLSVASASEAQLLTSTFTKGANGWACSAPESEPLASNVRLLLTVNPPGTTGVSLTATYPAPAGAKTTATLMAGNGGTFSATIGRSDIAGSGPIVVAGSIESQGCKLWALHTHRLGGSTGCATGQRRH
jgi:hypothetical protein